jgi:hypothetical protein
MAVYRKELDRRRPPDVRQLHEYRRPAQTEDGVEEDKDLSVDV